VFFKCLRFVGIIIVEKSIQSPKCRLRKVKKRKAAEFTVV
jgi:hypothetical protein